MAGRNVFNESRITAKAASADEPVIFISHRKIDAPAAREVAQTLLDADFTIYFDERDECLAGANEETDPDRVLRCIDAGLTRSTHLLGLVTENTRGSWWVPYEIGATRARSRDCAFLVGKEVKVLPAYMKVARVLKDRSELKEWLPSLLIKHGSRSRSLVEKMLGAERLHAGPKFVPLIRTETLDFQPIAPAPVATPASS